MSVQSRIMLQLKVIFSNVPLMWSRVDIRWAYVPVKRREMNLYLVSLTNTNCMACRRFILCLYYSGLNLIYFFFFSFLWHCFLFSFFNFLFFLLYFLLFLSFFSHFWMPRKLCSIIKWRISQSSGYYLFLIIRICLERRYYLFWISLIFGFFICNVLAFLLLNIQHCLLFVSGYPYIS